MTRISRNILLAAIALIPMIVPAQEVRDCLCLQPHGEDSVRFARFMEGGRGDGLLPGRSLSPALGQTGYREGIINNDGYVYQFRVALLITPEVIDEFRDAQGQFDRNLVYAYWERAEAELNSYYRNDVGIELKVVRDDRLIMLENNTGISIRGANGTPIADNGTLLINACIDSDEYDVGLMITKNTGSLNGAAMQGGAALNSTKGRGFAISAVKTVAHEMGHLFGASHTHERYDADYTEPGQGQSIMSYGDPRDFFSISSIRVMRNILKNINHYTDPERTQADKSYNSDEGANIVYAYLEEGVQPMIDTDLIKTQYTVTLGSSYQFYLPLLNADPEAVPYYCVHGFDIGTELSNNSLKANFRPTTSPNVMFHRQWRSPNTLVANAPESDWEVPYTGTSRTGLFKYAFAARYGSIYDSGITSVRIVPGEPFRAYFKEQPSLRHGRDFTIAWTPQTDIYGEGRRVRILLSTDYGQTFPYILADQIPNTGEWSGSFPYVDVSTTEYNGFNPLGGTIKVEIIGEAVYALTNNDVPYVANGSSYSVYGGFRLDTRNRFRIKGEEADVPEPYVRVTDESEIGEMPVLEAYYNNNNFGEVQGQEEREGCIIRRKWRKDCNGTIYTYTQIIELPAVRDANAALIKQLESVADELADLVSHEGQPGYPKPDNVSYRAIKSGYHSVFDADGRVLDSFDSENANALISSLEQLRNIGDEGIVYPQSGRYLLRSYQQLPAPTPYYYYTRDEGENGEETWTDDKALAQELVLTRQSDGTYLMRDAQGRLPWLQGMTNTYEDFRLERGFTWGSFTLVNHADWCAQLSRTGSTFSLNYQYADSPMSYRCNNNLVGTISMFLSTDFQFEPSAIPGDVNGDGSVTVGDVSMMVSYSLGQTVPEGFNLQAADVNGDGIVSVSDISEIVNAIFR